MIWTNGLPDMAALPFTPLILVSASLPNARQHRTLRWGSAEPQPYEYVPGAGDDEESWAHGLTPALLFQHAEELISAGPAGMEGLVKQLVTQSQAGGSSALSSRPDLPGSGSTPLKPIDSSNLMPAGLAPSSTKGWGPTHPSGLTFLANTRLALGPLAAGQPACAWQHVNAILNSYLHLPVKSSKLDRQGLARALPAALRFAADHLSHGRRVLIHDDDGLNTSVCLALAVLMRMFRHKTVPGIRSAPVQPLDRSAAAHQTGDAAALGFPLQLLPPSTTFPGHAETGPAALLPRGCGC
ncbi:hypothetical protein WJX84_005976 [Apatococcus fuscideae]|uniref:Uncharacterized protein n=1 Tax=Apatococcus fuscideae TaxID=2026836 RepID=A0AAW1SY35_9CHLO